MEPQFYEDYFLFIKEKAEFKNILDLGCGTGRIDKYFIEKGCFVHGVDLSEDMIAIAKDLHPQSNATFEVANMLDFQTQNTYDLVLCICDSLNYILGFENQIAVLKKAYDALSKEGTFIFDVHSQYKINELFKNYVEEDESEDFYFYWSVKKTATNQITHFVVIEDLNEDIRVEEKHVQESYPIENYINALKEIGFNHIEYSETFQENQRVVFVAKK